MKYIVAYYIASHEFVGLEVLRNGVTEVRFIYNHFTLYAYVYRLKMLY